MNNRITISTFQRLLLPMYDCVTINAPQKIIYSPKIKVEDRGPITNWLGDSLVWMDIAVMLDRESGRSPSNADPDHHKLNVAHVAAGFAFELALKALVKSEDESIKEKHKTFENYEKVSEENRSIIEQKMENGPLNDVRGIFKYIDERMCHADRKYWMVGKGSQRRGTGFSNIPGQVIPDLRELHQLIVDLAVKNTYKWRRSA